MRNVILGQHRFDALQESLGIPRAILARRLQRLVSEGLLERRRYEERPPRYEYVLTAKGAAFWDVLAALWRFGEDWLWEPGERPPVELVDRETGEPVRAAVVDERTGRPLSLDRIRVRRARTATKEAPRP
jgi:DNA-binding HxlR family transcriptional regulator